MIAQYLSYNIFMESKELKRYNLPEDRILLGIIDAKPDIYLLIIFFIGVLTLLFKQYSIGLAFISLALLSFMFLPKRVLVEFYDNYLVLYNHASKNDCEMIYYDEVVKWRYTYGVSYDELQIILVDNSIHRVDGFSRMIYESQMNRFLKDKRDKTRKTKNNK